MIRVKYVGTGGDDTSLTVDHEYAVLQFIPPGSAGGAVSGILWDDLNERFYRTGESLNDSNHFEIVEVSVPGCQNLMS